MKTIKCVALVVAIFAIVSCETEIPITDTTPPEFSIQITGDGFNRIFDQDSDFNNFQLNLRDGARYDFTYTGSDSGGVELIQWQADTGGNIIFETPISSPWTSRDISSLSRMIEWRGNRNNPLTGNVITGRFRANGENISLFFRFHIRDFGGERRVPNSTSGALSLYLGNHSTEVIQF